MRALCASLADVTERSHFGQPMFYVGKKPFASCSDKHGAWEIVVALEPEHASALIDSDSRFTPYRAAKHAVSFDPTQVKPWSQVKALVLESYELARAQKAAPRRRPRAAKPTARRR